MSKAFNHRLDQLNKKDLELAQATKEHEEKRARGQTIKVQIMKVKSI